MVDGEQAIKLKAETIKRAVMVDAQPERSKSSSVRVPVI